MQLSPNFTLSELTQSQTAARFNLDNTPDAEAIENLRVLCTDLLEPLRGLLGVPIIVNSGFRSVAVNRRVGGSASSQHCKGEAADVHFGAGMTVQEAFQKVRESGLVYDQLIEEGTWLHISYRRDGRNRRQVLRATFRDGKASYSKA